MNRGRSTRQAIILANGVTVAGTLPAHLTGALAVQLTGNLAFGVAALGTAIGLLRVSSALSATYFGRLTDRLGATRAMRVAATIAAAACFGVALTARDWWSLTAWLVVAGWANALSNPVANRMLVRNVRQERLGVAFGMKQSAPPGSSMLAGLSVPLIALTVGWRWAYALAGVLALGVAFGLATGSSTIISAFYVDSAVRAGTPAQLAGFLLAAGAFLTIACRLGLGVLADRMRHGHLALCAGMLLSGSLGLVLLASARPVLMTPGILLAMSSAWGFNGVFWYALMRTNADTPGRVTGAITPAGYIGASAGPVAFGLLAQHLGYATAWLCAAALTVAAGLTMLLAAGWASGAGPGPATAPPE